MNMQDMYVIFRNPKTNQVIKRNTRKKGRNFYCSFNGVDYMIKSYVGGKKFYLYHKGKPRINVIKLRLRFVRGL